MENKKLHIFVGFKGGLGKSKLAKHIFPTILHRVAGTTKFNIVEIDDTETVDVWSSDNIVFNKFTVDEYKDGIVQLQSTLMEDEISEILDIGGGKEKVFKILEQIKQMDLHLFYDLEFYIPTNKDATIFNSTKSTIETINDMFEVKPNLIYNRVFFDYKKEFKTIFGNENWGIEAKYDEIKNLISEEFVVYEDYESQIETIIDQLNQSGFDFYLHALEFEKNYVQNFKDPNKTTEDRISLGKEKAIVSDYLNYFRKIFIVEKQESKKSKKWVQN